MPTDDLAAEGDRLHAAATPGPWAIAPWMGTTIIPETWVRWDKGEATEEARGPFCCIGGDTEPNAEFIVWLRNNWPAIAAALRSADWNEDMARTRGEENEALRARCAAAEADADRLVEAWRTGPQAWQDALAAHAAAVEARHAD